MFGKNESKGVAVSRIPGFEEVLNIGVGCYLRPGEI
jgi:hypothetical protein